MRDRVSYKCNFITHVELIRSIISGTTRTGEQLQLLHSCILLRGVHTDLQMRSQDGGYLAGRPNQQDT